MNKYEILISNTEYTKMIIEAETAQEAEDIAQDQMLNGGELARLLTEKFTNHKEAPYETCIFRINEGGERTDDMFSHVVAEYQTQDEAAEGHDKIVKAFQENKKLYFKDTFTNEDVDLTL